MSSDSRFLWIGGFLLLFLATATTPKERRRPPHERLLWILVAVLLGVALVLGSGCASERLTPIPRGAALNEYGLPASTPELADYGNRQRAR